MRLIGLAVVLALGQILAPLAAEAQPEGKVYRIGYLTPFALPSPRGFSAKSPRSRLHRRP